MAPIFFRLTPSAEPDRSPKKRGSARSGVLIFVNPKAPVASFRKCFAIDIRNRKTASSPDDQYPSKTGIQSHGGDEHRRSAGKITRRISRDDAQFEVKSFPGFISLRMPHEDRHFWSPRLNLSMEEIDEGKTQLLGKYGPNANVWSLFLFGYLFIGSLGMFAAVLAISQWFIGSSPWGFWLLGGAMPGLLILFGAAHAGQKLGAKQIELLHKTYESGINESVEIH